LRLKAGGMPEIVEIKKLIRFLAVIQRVLESIPEDNFTAKDASELEKIDQRLYALAERRID